MSGPVDRPYVLGDNPLTALTGIPVIVSPFLPQYPSDGEDARRIVRHGLAQYLAWWGEDPGPKPGQPIDALLINDHALTRAARTLAVSAERFEQIKAEYGRDG